MDLQYISDISGNHTAVIIPIEKWNNITEKHQDLKQLEKPKNNAARFKNLLNREEADKYNTYLQKAREQWERDI
jgi:hypothetical protein